MGLLSAVGGIVDIFTGGSGIGSLIGGALDSESASAEGRRSQEEANAQNVALAKENRDFQERMSGSSYQRAVKDMQAAGLNPMLAYSQGGASTPSGSLSQVEPKMALGNASALQGAQTMQGVSQLAMNGANIANTRALTDKIRSETFDKDVNSAIRYNELLNAQYTGNEIDSRARKTQQELVNAAVEESLKRLSLSRDQSTFSADVAKRKAESKLTQLEIPRSESEAGMYKDLGKAAPELKWLIEILRGGRSVIGGR